jgi:eukaryotic-like serine/threonine-protein kinase
MYVTACVAFVPGCIPSGRKRLEREPCDPAQHRTCLTAPRARPPQTLRPGIQPRMSTLTGARISRYEILELLGSGGMGEVYRARDHDLHRDVAIKFLPQRFITDPTRLARFEQEARTASALNHPNIVTIHEIGVVPGTPPYIVMEYVQGQTLRAALHETRLAPRLVLDIASQLADGIAKAHTAGIVHRDLKPENVMVTADGFVKILDFGLAKLRSDLPAGTAVGVGSETQETGPSPDTAIGVLVGTTAYMSPEQARGGEADFHADQFALGVMLYEMATGRRPFRGESVVQTLTAVIEDEPEPIALTRPEFPEAARQIVGRCLAKAPRDRYASTVDLARDLRQARERMNESGAAFEAAPVVPEHARARVGRRRGWRVAALGSVVAAATLLYSASGKIGRWWLPLPPEMRLVVLPITADHGPQLAQGYAGLQEYVTARLGDLQRFRSRLAVVPAAEVLDGGARSPSAARRLLGANLALSITVHDTGSDRLVTVSLADTSSVRQLRGDARTFAAGTFSPEAVVELATPLLDLELGPDEQRRWSGAASPVPQASVLLAQALAQTPYQQARSALEEYDHQASLERAINLFNQAVDLDPRYAAAHAGLAEARLRLYRLMKRAVDLELASQSADRALGLDDTRPAAWIARGMVLSARGDLAAAEQAFNEAIKRNPAGANAYRELGTAYLRAGEPEKAEQAHRRAVALDPKSWSGYSDLAVFLMRRQRFDEAEGVLQQGLQIAPGNPRLLATLGAALLYQRRWAEAEAAFRRATSDQPYGSALSNLGWLQFRVRREYGAAARTFERATAASPRDYRLWKNLAEAYRLAPGERERSAGALQKAIGLLEEERTVDPRNPTILVELGDCHAMLGQAPQARPLVAEARRLAPKDGDVAYTAATAYEAIGDRDAAIAAIAAAFDADFDLLEVESDTGLEQLRADPRYTSLLEKYRQRQAGHPR